MSLKKTIITLISFCIGIFILTGCSNSNDSEPLDAQDDKDIEKTVLQMVTKATFPPFEFTDTENGEEEFKGIDIDIAKHITEQLDVELEITSIDFSSIIGSLQQGRADFAITGMTATPEREKNVDFTDPYFIPREAIIWNKEGSDEYTTIEDLEGKKVATSIGTMQHDKMENAKGVSVTAMDGNSPVVEEVLSGRVDAGFLISTQAESYMETNSDLDMNIVPMDPDDKIGFAIALPKDSEWKEKFDEELDKMKEDGTLDDIILEWLGEEYID